MKQALRLSRAEFWLLGAVVDVKLPLSVLTLPEGPPWDRPTIDVALNRGSHGLKRGPLRKTLLDLFQRGWIRFRQGHASDPRSDDAVTGLASQVCMQRWPDNVFYELTPQGGYAWESFARPDWSFQIDQRSTFNDPPVSDAARMDFDARFGVTTEPEERLEWHEIAAASNKMLQRFLRELADDYDFVEKQRESLTSWQATYWKTLPSGVMVTLLARERMGVERGGRSSDWHRYWCRWY